MKPNELTVGDYVTFQGCQNDEAPVILKIWQINGDGEAFAFINDEEGTDEIIIDDEIVGIPITENFLKENFEKKTFYGIYDDYFDLDIREYSDGLYIVTYHSCEINIPDQTALLSFVHELQHFLKLCGIEHEIKL